MGAYVSHARHRKIFLFRPVIFLLTASGRKLGEETDKLKYGFTQKRINHSLWGSEKSERESITWYQQIGVAFLSSDLVMLLEVGEKVKKKVKTKQCVWLISCKWTGNGIGSRETFYVYFKKSCQLKRQMVIFMVIFHGEFSVVNLSKEIHKIKEVS